MLKDRWRANTWGDQYKVDAETAERIFRRNVRVMAEQGATVRDIVLELSRQGDGDYKGEPIPSVQQRVEEAVSELGLKVSPRLDDTAQDPAIIAQTTSTTTNPVSTITRSSPS